MEFKQRRGSGPPSQPVEGSGVAGILAAYGVEPSRISATPEVEDDHQEAWTPPSGSSGHGGTSGYKYRAAFRGGVEGRDALINKYPALQNGVVR